MKFTRSRPYKKDDTAHIEQKNWTHIRQWFGYERHENPEVVPRLNALTTGAWGQVGRSLPSGLEAQKQGADRQPDQARL